MRNGWRLLFLLLAPTAVSCGQATDDESQSLGGAQAASGGQPELGGSESIGGGTASGPGIGGNAGTTGGSGAGGTDESSGGFGGDGPSACTRVLTGEAHLYLTNQTQVESMRGVGKVEGSLYVTGDVQDLSPLECLSEVTNDFGVFEAKQLVNVDGLEQLRTIGRNLYIGHYCRYELRFCSGNPLLQDLRGLKNLERVQDIFIEPLCDGEGNNENCKVNVALAEVNLNRLLEATEVYIRMNPALSDIELNGWKTGTSFAALENDALKTISARSLKGAVQVSVSSAPQLELLEMPSLEKPTALRIASTHLSSLTGLDSLQSSGSFEISSNSELTSLEGLSSLEAVAGRFNITGNNSLKRLTGLEHLERVGSLDIHYNDLLETLDALSALVEVTETFRMSWNENLPTCEAERLQNQIPSLSSDRVTLYSNDDDAVCEP